MPNLNDKIKTIVLVMFENRSFDHMLGHLSLEGIIPLVDGVRNPLEQYKNIYKGDFYSPFVIENDGPLPFDLPHEKEYVEIQIALSTVSENFRMNGFVEAYANSTEVPPNPKCEPLGVFKSTQVPITSFLAQNFCVCERWFSPLPTSTQPNRTMAFCGSSKIWDTATRPIPCDESVFDWMKRSNIRWRVYHDGISFFAFYPHLWPEVLGPDFKDFEYLHKDILEEKDETFPQLIIIEPSYNDAPHVGPDHPNDNHAPLAVGWGEDYLRRIYEAVTLNEERWKQTVLIVYYDEHGGFWDHVPPPKITSTIHSNPEYNFNSLGPRIPGIIVSPFVEKGSICNKLFDHTSVLQFLAEVFTPGEAYSTEVDQRRKQGIKSISETITLDSPRIERPNVPSDPIEVSTALGNTIYTSPTNNMGKAFESITNQLLTEKRGETLVKYPELVEWQAVKLGEK